jgi:3-hydroxyacyl-CoA dehydrogenase/enoyl-CoA hydratase/3-hydroxybutyryl-CoA epimerase
MTEFKHWRYHIDKQNICWLALDVVGSSVNILRREVMTEWALIMDKIGKAEGLSGLCLLSGKERGFVYGADIAEFDNLKTEADVRELIELADSILSGIEVLPYPTVCGIDGVAVGGGLELALAFDRIVVTSSAETKLGFPEIHLGIMPGYGGTGRAMRRIKAEHVLDMVLSGCLLSGVEAKALGLVDTVIDDAADLRQAVADELTQPSVPDLGQTDSDVEQAVGQAEETILQTLKKERTPAPFLICEHFRASGADWRALVKTEPVRFSKMLLGEASHHLRRVFLLNDMVRKSARGDSQIKKVHVIGAGTMGADIAAVAAMSGFQTSLSDLDAEAVKNAVTRAGKLFERRLKTEDKVSAAAGRLIADIKGKEIAKADIIIEAVAERLTVKQNVFRAVEAKAKQDAILATNTSSIMIEDIASALQAPERLIGLHFFNPVPVLPLVEVVAGPLSNTAFISRAMQFAGQLKKMPVKVKSVKGFLVNRALLPYLFASIDSMIAGEAPDKLDQALTRFGMPMGPIELCDQIGLDVCFDVGQVLGMSDTAFKALQDKVNSGQLGRKSGSGFYDWDDKKAMRPRADYPGDELEKLAAELLSPMIEMCRSAVTEEIVDTADHADIGCILGIGFPAYRGGPLGWADYPRA